MNRGVKSVYGGKWPRVRLAILERDNGICQIKGKDCTTLATDVDHIVPVAAGGPWYDPDNLRAACRTCNQARKVTRGSRNWQSSATEIILVTGPQNADLLGYIRTHKGQDDTVISLVALSATLGTPEAARAAVAAMVSKVRRAEIRTARVWIATHDRAAELHYPSHRVVIVGGQGDPNYPGDTQENNHTNDTWRRGGNTGNSGNSAGSRPW